MAGVLSEVHILLGDRAALPGLWLPAGDPSSVQRTNPARPAIQCDGHHRPALADMGSRSSVAAVSGIAGAPIYGGEIQAKRSASHVDRDCRDGFLDPAKRPLPSV